MDEVENTIEEVLEPCIGARITGVHEDEYAVFLHLDDGQVISITSLEEGGFHINAEIGSFH